MECSHYVSFNPHKNPWEIQEYLTSLGIFFAGGLDISTRWFDDGLIMVNVGKI